MVKISYGYIEKMFQLNDDHEFYSRFEWLVNVRRLRYAWYSKPITLLEFLFAVESDCMFSVKKQYIKDKDVLMDSVKMLKLDELQEPLNLLFNSSIDIEKLHALENSFKENGAILPKFVEFIKLHEKELACDVLAVSSEEYDLMIEKQKQAENLNIENELKVGAISPSSTNEKVKKVWWKFWD